MFRNRWTYAAHQAAWVLAVNLVIRYFGWSDGPMFSWNVPIALAVGFLIGLAIWPIHVWMERLAALKLRHDERHYNEAMAKIDAFLNHPETGIQIKRNGRRGDHDSQ